MSIESGSNPSMPTMLNSEVTYVRFEKVDKRLALMRGIENDPESFGFSIYTTNRSGFEYLIEMQGLRGSLEYAAGLGNGVVLDIGAGTGRGVSDLYDYSIYAKIPLWFEATVLNKNNAVDCRLAPSRIHETSVEQLEGIPDRSVSLALSVYSIMYSAEPDLAVRRIDDVLVPGGVLKATFASNPRFVMTGSEPFIRSLRDLGYDVEVNSPSFDKEVYDRDDLILAIKPGGQKYSAKELLRLDQHQLTNSLNDLFAMKLKFGNI